MTTDLPAVSLQPEFTALLNGITEPAALLSPDYRILAANTAYLNAYEKDGPLVNRHCYEVSHHYSMPCDQAGETCPLKACITSGEARRVLHLHHTPGGDEHVDVSMTPIRDADGSIVYLLEKIQQTHAASSQPAAEGLVGRTPAFNRMLELLQRVAPGDTAVLLLGESGTGKEMVARAVHQNSPRAAGPFVPVECAGLSETLFESELFGHEKGAFTGASARKVGLVESAGGGTLFLDEIGDIPLSQQVKLLRLLETGTFRRVGGIEARKADFRLVLATHRDLAAQVQAGSFREDLYYRISVFPIRLPSLRERSGDLELLTHSLLRRIAPGRELELSPGAMACLQDYPFPGNIRELRNVLERAALLADGDTLLPEHLPEQCRDPQTPGHGHGSIPEELVTLAENERRYLARALAACPNDRQALADRLGISKRTLFRKLDELRS
jgi:DNA-binding NtrC family response regulator